MLADALDSFAQIFTPPFRGVMWKSLGLTAAILVLAGVGLDRLALSLIHVGLSWLSTVLSIVVALGLIAGIELEPGAGKPGARAFEVFLKCFERGVMVRQTGDVIALSPPLIIEPKQIAEVIETLTGVIREIS